MSECQSGLMCRTISGAFWVDSRGRRFESYLNYVLLFTVWWFICIRSMKKLWMFGIIFLTLLMTQAANVRIFWTQTPPPDAKSVKVYYGSQQNTYTNSQVFDLETLPFLTNTIPAYDTFSCTNTTGGNTKYVKVAGLQYNQQFFWAYSYINTNGVEGPIVAHSVCGFTVTNRTDEVVTIPTDFRTTK
jgi:hypothetical protein